MGAFARGSGAASQSALSRRKIAMGAVRVGRTRRGSAASKAGCGDRRAHITSPDKTQLIEKLGLITSDAARQHFGFPGGGRDFVALQLLDDLQRAIHAVQSAARNQVLPAKQKALELCGGDRLDFAAKLAQRQAMNPRQDATVAPFGFALRADRG